MPIARSTPTRSAASARRGVVRGRNGRQMARNDRAIRPGCKRMRARETGLTCVGIRSGPVRRAWTGRDTSCRGWLSVEYHHAFAPARADDQRRNAGGPHASRARRERPVSPALPPLAHVGWPGRSRGRARAAPYAGSPASPIAGSTGRRQGSGVWRRSSARSARSIDAYFGLPDLFLSMQGSPRWARFQAWQGPLLRS